MVYNYGIPGAYKPTNITSTGAPNVVCRTASRDLLHPSADSGGATIDEIDQVQPTA